MPNPKYLNKAQEPGSYRDGYPFFGSGEIRSFPPDVVPSKFWLPLNKEAQDQLAKLGIARDIVELDDEGEPVLEEGIGQTLRELAPPTDKRITEGPVAKEDDDAAKVDEAFAKPAEKLEQVAPGVTKKPRASDQKI